MAQSPIEAVFTLNLRESLLSYQQYYEQLIKEKEALQTKVKTGLAMSLLDAKSHGNIQDQNSINKKIDEQIKQINQKFQAAIDCLVQSYDEHMKVIIPEPQLLPVRLSVQIVSESTIRIENLNLKPYENMNDLMRLIEEYQIKRGDPILDWNKPSLIFEIIGPLRLDADIMKDMQRAQENQMEIEGETNSLSQHYNIQDINQPISKYKIAAGSMIKITGGPIKLESNKPLLCMTLNYEKEKDSTYNYFSCKTCKFNWICEGCRDGCHKGHELLPHMMNHRPTWACCYCMKNNKCLIPNKKKPAGIKV